MAVPAGRSSGGWESKVEWKGLTKLAYACKNIKKEMGPACRRVTRWTAQQVYDRAHENLSGRMVNVRTGFLRSRLQMKQLNQYASLVYDDAFYAVFVHNGTRSTRPRPFLTEAVRHVQRYVPGEMGKVMTQLLKDGKLLP